MKSDSYSPFGVALIDLFASALGAFIVLCFIFMPYFLNTSNFATQRQYDAAVAEIAKLEAVADDLAAAERALERQKNATAQATRKAGDVRYQLTQLQKQKAAASRTLVGTAINIPIIFDGNQWYLRPEHHSVLDLVGREASQGDFKININGHTSGSNMQNTRRYCIDLDEYGERNSTNRNKDIAPKGKGQNHCFEKYELWLEHLSKMRATSVKQYLIDTFNISPNRISVNGFGFQKPLPGLGDDDARHRRVEISYQPK